MRMRLQRNPPTRNETRKLPIADGRPICRGQLARKRAGLLVRNRKRQEAPSRGFVVPRLDAAVRVGFARSIAASLVVAAAG